MTSPAPPAFSVIVPVYNVAGHVGACIASLRAQTARDFEVIVIDDGATDNSLAEARAAIGDDARFRVIRQANAGLSAARNAGLDAATGELIAFVDSDDRVAPDYLEALAAALTASGADWVACAIRFDYPDGGQATHSAIHGAPDLADHPEMRLYTFENWCDAIPHFPSAWNKLYRRALIEGLRFDPGTLWEDHAFFHRAAARTTAIAHLPRPLYWQTRDRPGQITGADDDGVFQQFEVLDTVAGIWAGSDRPGATTALARLTSRLGFERSTSLRDPDRRRRFVAAAADYMARRGLHWDADWDADIAPRWGLELAGTCPLSVVLPWDGQAAPLADTLAALAAQPPGGWQIEMVISRPTDRAPAETALAGAGLAARARLHFVPGAGPGAARNAGLAEARGACVMFLDAGDRVLPGALDAWTDALLRNGADMGISAFRIGLGEGPVHSGFHDPAGLPPGGPVPGPLALSPERALALHSHPSAKIFRRAFLLEQGLQFGTGPLPDWQLTLGAALAAEHALYFDGAGVESGESPAARRQWHAPVPMRQLAATVAALPAALPPGAAARLPPGWQRRLLARAAWEQLSFATPPRGWRRRWSRLGLGWALRRRDLGPRDIALDPYLPDWLIHHVRHHAPLRHAIASRDPTGP